MFAFGMLGSYFSQGVYAVAGPFQGAVDIIVVQQEDGSFKSSPWYVRCGDFQGVLTRREKIVDISVNDVPADFYMLLNSRGEAYFEKEVEDVVLALPSTSLSSEGPEENKKLEGLGDWKVVATEEGSQVHRADADVPTQGRSSDKGKGLVDDLGLVTASRVRESQNTVDQSSNSSAGQSSHHLVGLQGAKDVELATSSSHISHSSYPDQLDSLSLTADDTFVEQQPSISGIEAKCMVLSVSGENLVLAEADSILPKRPADEESSLVSDDGGLLELDDEHLITDTSSGRPEGAAFCQLNPVITEDWLESQDSSSWGSGDEGASIRNEPETSNAGTLDELIADDSKIVTADEEEELRDALCTAPAVGVHIDSNSLIPSMASEKNSEFDDLSVWVSDALVDESAINVAVDASTGCGSPIPNSNGESSKDGATSDKAVAVKEGPQSKDKSVEVSTVAVVPPPSRWNMWPLSLRRSRAEKAHASEVADTNKALLAATSIAVKSPLTAEILRKNGYYQLAQKPKLRSYVPTSAQIESLKLKGGPNKVTFTFPRVLGRAKVDANIYLWKWKTRIVISDVDGTITKSDVLGQFMPLVGRDWSQSGVTRLFSAIKENGYEVLFLSARAISQAYLTRQFLVNLKQDGEMLPEGPVFISPDGLIPSLYREVVRRAPHEFKISCLEGIKRLFPNDVNPFYAGFGNRDTDELSYLKVGIPKGKIFIINPKGEVMVNHHVDAKSYTSIHALVDDMFPPVYSSEQEDFNTWNYWKLPQPDFVDELSAPSPPSKARKGGTAKK